MMTSHQPYILRAIYDWVCDNNMTPYIAVNANEYEEDMSVPWQYVEEGRIVFNISPEAINNLVISESISFTSRFSGLKTEVYFPITAVLGIYAKESGKGIVFREERGIELFEDIDDEQEEDPLANKSVPYLKRIK